MQRLRTLTFAGLFWTAIARAQQDAQAARSRGLPRQTWRHDDRSFEQGRTLRAVTALTSRRVLTADSPTRARLQRQSHGRGACGANGAAPSAATRYRGPDLVRPPLWA